jgi:glycosyltransferase involved in cell wall biosynthesis
MLEGDEKWGAFLAAEAFILPSHQENFGIAVAEAMACGKAVLLSEKVNIAPEIVAVGAGLMQPDTEEGTHRLIAGWIAMPPIDRERMAAAARQLYIERYDMRKNARDVSDLLYEAIHAPTAGFPATASALK